MPRLSINASYNNAINNLNVINRYLTKSKSLPFDMQGFVAELLMLRLFSVLETCVRDVSVRIACGVSYRDGTSSNPIVLCSNIDDAIEKFKTEGRANRIKNLHFSNVSNTNEAIKNVIQSTEPLRLKLTRFGVAFEEMRKVRNHIAHRTSNTYNDYKSVIRSHYGAYLKIKPSSFLISTKREPRPVIDTYLQTAKIIIDEITKG